MYARGPFLIDVNKYVFYFTDKTSVSFCCYKGITIYSILLVALSVLCV